MKWRYQRAMVFFSRSNLAMADSSNHARNIVLAHNAIVKELRARIIELERERADSRLPSRLGPGTEN